MKYSDLDIYLSYSWKQTSEATQLEQELFEEWSIILRRDRKEIMYKDSISNFMSELAGSKHIILLLSNDYFESENCMNEFVSILNNSNFSDRISPIQIDNGSLKIHSSKDKSERVSYWEKELEKSSKFKDSMKNDYQKLSNICSGLGDALSKLSDLNTSTFSELKKSKFQMIVDDISKKYTKTFEDPKYLISIKPFDSVNLYQPQRIGEMKIKSLKTATKVTFYLKLETNENGKYSWINHDGEPTQTTSILKPLQICDSYNNHFFDFSNYDFLFEISSRNSSPIEISIKSRLNSYPTPVPTSSQ